MAQIRFNLSFLLQQATATAQFSAAESDSFIAALREPLDSLGEDWEFWNTPNGVAIRFIRKDEDITLIFHVLATDTAGDVFRLLGPDADSDPPSFRVSRAGFGAGADAIVQILQVGQALGGYALETVGVASLILGGLRKSQALRYRESRAAVRSWRMSGGDPPEELLSRITARRTWSWQGFHQEFDTDERTSGELLRLARYEKSPYSDDWYPKDALRGE